MTLKEMYAEKGELTTTLEITQAKLKNINGLIVKELNKPQAPVETKNSKTV